MPNSTTPIVSMADDGEVILIQRNLPEPVTYRGSSFIALAFSDATDDPRAFFANAAFTVPEGRGERPFASTDLDELTVTVDTAMRTGFSEPRIFPHVRSGASNLHLNESPKTQPRIESSAPVTAELQALRPAAVASALKAGKRLTVHRNIIGGLTYRFVEEPKQPRPELLIVEQYQLSTHLGQYGAGRVAKTFSLLPGEKTKISVRSFLKTETERKEASSILDSVTNESAADFQSTLEREQADKAGYAQTFEYHSEGEAEASWGFGRAKLSGGVKGSTNATREETSKNVAKAVEKHAAKASAKRDVEINTSFEVTATAENETSIEREIENINVSRTLNFVFRQMNQEFFSILHLVDVRVAFFNGFVESRREVPLYDIDSLLDEVVKPEHHAKVREDIEQALGNILDHNGDLHTDFVVERIVGDESYRRVNRELVSEYRDPITNTTIQVPGIITSVTKSVMRTEGVMVEALKGSANALDSYATELQEIEVERRRAEAQLVAAKVSERELAVKLVEDNDTERTTLLERLTCPCQRNGDLLDEDAT